LWNLFPTSSPKAPIFSLPMSSRFLLSQWIEASFGCSSIIFFCSSFCQECCIIDPPTVAWANKRRHCFHRRGVCWNWHKNYSNMSLHTMILVRFSIKYFKFHDLCFFIEKTTILYFLYVLLAWNDRKHFAI
jgi:hypothetical protein